MRNIDGWAMAFIVFGTAGIVSMLPNSPARLTHYDQLAASRAVIRDQVDYKIVITGNRTPAECKDLGESATSDLILKCNALAARETQMTLIPVNETVKVADKP